MVMNIFIVLMILTVWGAFISLITVVVVDNKQPLKLSLKQAKNKQLSEEIDYEQVRTFVELQNIINYDGTSKNQLDLEAINKYYGKD